MPSTASAVNESNFDPDAPAFCEADAGGRAAVTSRCARTYATTTRTTTKTVLRRIVIMPPLHEYSRPELQSPLSVRRACLRRELSHARSSNLALVFAPSPRRPHRAASGARPDLRPSP